MFGMTRRWDWLRSPLFWVLVIAFVLRVPGLFWGLPASDGWDDDGVAPRNFLVGIALAYMPGSYFTYPPLHMFLLAVFALPGVVTALLKAHALNQAGLTAEFIKVPYMTAFAVVARLVSVAMSLGTIVCVSRMAELVGGRRAGLFAALACVLNAAFTYYGVVTNLDGPEVFWCSISLLFWMHLVRDRDPKQAKWATLSAAAAVATKDQAYAAFLVAIPAVLALWLAIDPEARAQFRRIFLPIVLWSAIAILALLFVDGAITNPFGFARRIAFLTGPASRDYAEYASNGSGYLQLLGDVWAHIPRFYPVPVVLLGAAGVALHAARFRENRAQFAAGLLPLFAAVSFTLAFNFVVLRTGNRFLLLQFLLLAVYVGSAVDWLVFAAPPALRLFFRALIPPLAVLALYQCIGIDWALLFDPRYDAENWLASHAARQATVETYGRNAFLPRFPADTVVSRIDSIPLEKRNPQSRMTELRVPPEAIEDRQPRFVVVSTFVVRDDFGVTAKIVDDDRVVALTLGHAVGSLAAQVYFRALYEGKLHYRLVHVSAFKNWFWQSLDGYESLAQPILIFERRD